MGQDPKSDFNKMVTALGLNVSDVSMAAAVDAAVQWQTCLWGGAARCHRLPPPLEHASRTRDRLCARAAAASTL